MADEQKSPGPPKPASAGAGGPTPPPPPNSPSLPPPPPQTQRAQTAGEIGSENVQKVAPTGEDRSRSAHVQASALHEKIKATEAELRSLEDQRSTKDAKARATVRAQLAELKDREAREKGGLNDLTPIGNLLAVDSAVFEQYPDDHVRWLNEGIPGRAALARAKGYERVPGQTQGGDMVLWKINREKWASGVATKEAQTERQIERAGGKGQRDDMVQELQTFFDKNNVKIDANDLVMKERG